MTEVDGDRATPVLPAGPASSRYPHLRNFFFCLTAHNAVKQNLDFGELFRGWKTGHPAWFRGCTR
jgi:hypothetical protein